VRIRYNAPVILTFTLFSLLALLIDTKLWTAANETLFSSPARPDWSSPLTYLRMFLHVFGHKDWAHWLGNLTIILLVGPLVEEKYRSGPLLCAMVITAALTALFDSLLFTSGLMGASGIAFLLIVLGSFSNFKKREIPLTFLLVAGIFLGQEALSVFTADNVSRFAHLAGGFVGVLFGFALAGDKKESP